MDNIVFLNTQNVGLKMDRFIGMNVHDPIYDDMVSDVQLVYRILANFMMKINVDSKI